MGKQTSRALIFGNAENTGIEVHNCEFLDAHDLYLFGQDVRFHHNWINNLQDEGLALGFDKRTGDPITVTKIHDNVITMTLTGRLSLSSLDS